MAIGRAITCLLATSLVFANGCRTPQVPFDPGYANVGNAIQHSYRSLDSGAEAVAPVIADLEGPHAVEEYVRFALQQNPKIQAARKRVEAAAYRVPVAASLQDPMLNVTVLPSSVQTASGEQEMIIAASQKIPWMGKLDAKAAVAESQTDMARAALAATELATVAQVKRAYYNLYFLQQSLVVTEEEQRLLGEFRDVADTRYRAGTTSQQDVYRADLEISAVEADLIRLRQQLSSTRARLASALHVAPQTQLMAVDRLPAEGIPLDLELLQRQAVAARPELHAQLAAIGRDRRAAELARLDYKPDVTVGFSWIDIASSGISPVANGRDALLLTAGINLPIYQKRLNSAVRAAEANAVATAREYDTLRDGTLEDVTDLFAQAGSQHELLVLFREDILPKARLTLEVSAQAYNVGEVDFLQLIDNWRQLLRYEINYRRLETSLRQTLANLEAVVGGVVVTGAKLGDDRAQTEVSVE
jgi:cobalt-zinc-cadmium efflux system outer membrane protein